jgi:imidazole glycerol-phosphate synthase subunit HisH
MGPRSMGQDISVTIIDYGMGNVRSVAKAIELLGEDVKISNDKNDIENATHLILPGVGAFKDGMKNLKELGLVEILNEQVLEKKKPILGICLGTQLMANESEEFGHYEGLKWIDASVVAFDDQGGELKVPHVGWNDTQYKKESPIFKKVKEDTDFYYVHSYHMVCKNEEDVSATCDYGGEFVAAIQKDNIFATQFHPEKSQYTGLKLLENFLEVGQE